MISIYNGESHKLRLEIYKGGSTNLETFSNATYKVLLITNNNRYPLVTEIKDGVLYATVPSGIETGSPDIKVLWIKNADSLRDKGDSRNYNYAEKVNAFAVTNVSSEATSIADDQVICIKMHALTYGYDGLDAYEIGLLRGTWTGSESAWLSSKLGEFITTDQIANGAIVKAKIGNQSVTMEKLGGDVTARLTQIEASVTAEAAARNGADSSLGASISQVTSRVGAEEARAKAAEANKVDKVNGKGLSTNDFTNADKAALDVAYDARIISGYTSATEDEVTVTLETEDSGDIDINIGLADLNRAGLMSKADKIKLNNISIEDGQLKIVCDGTIYYFEPSSIIIPNDDDADDDADDDDTFPGGVGEAVTD